MAGRVSLVTCAVSVLLVYLTLPCVTIPYHTLLFWYDSMLKITLPYHHTFC